MNKKYLRTGFLIAFILLTYSIQAEIFEEIYAIVNDEIITLSEIKAYEKDLLRMVQTQFKGEELQTKFDELKAQLLNQIIEQKLIESKLKEKKYDVEADIELIIKEIKKQNNIEDDEELIEALKKEGISFDNWKDFLRKKRAQDRLFYEEIGSKIKIDNAQVVEYYRKNIKKYTTPEKRKVSAIFLDKNKTVDLLQLKEEIITKLTQLSFEEVAQDYSQLQSENKSELGEFSHDELEQKLADAIWKLKLNEISEWIDTENGSYLLRLDNITPEKIIPLNEVQNEIQETMRLEIQQSKIKDYIEQLKKDSYIKIIKEYK